MNVGLPPLPPPGAAMSEIGRGLLVAAAFLVILLGAEAWQRRAAPPVEWTRKLVHAGGGLLAAGLPWLLTSPWMVFGLCLAFGGVIRGGQRLGLWSSVFGITRRSAGDLYFILGALLLFLTGRDQPLFYLISLLVLTLADPAAALIGSTFGRRRYVVGENQRSLEGSGAFFLTGFAIMSLALLLGSDMEAAVALLLSAHLALLLTGVEAVSPRGSDNLTVPVACFFLLVWLGSIPPDRLSELVLLHWMGLGAVGLVLGIVSRLAAFREPAEGGREG